MQPKMGHKEKNKEKKQIVKGWDWHKETLSFKPFRSKINGIEDKMHKSGVVKTITDYMQINFNSDVAETIRSIKRSTFKVPKKLKEDNQR